MEQKEIQQEETVNEESVELNDETIEDTGPDEDFDQNTVKHENPVDVSIYAIRRMLEQEVTWSALASIGGVGVVAWNVLNYFFTLVSSFIIFGKTNVPMYLLVKRQNVDFANGYLLYATIITVLWFYAVSKYNVEGRFVHIIGFVLGILVALTDLIGARTLFRSGGYSTMTLGAGVLFAYVLPAVIVFGLIYFEAEYKKAKMWIEEEHASGETHVPKMLEEITDSSFIRKRRRLHIFCLIFIWCAFLSKEEFFSYCQVDQYNRVVVADLGERFIVQDFVTKEDDNNYYIDTSRYYVVNVIGERVTMVFKPRAQIKPLKESFVEMLIEEDSYSGP